MRQGVGWVTQWFGMNAGNYLSYGFAGHEGLDYGCAEGSEVLAAADGAVVTARDTGGAYGKLVTLAHDGGWMTYYAHLSEIRVRQGERVSRGQVIALSGNTGRSTGPHLHFGLKYLHTTNGSKGFVDPVPFRE